MSPSTSDSATAIPVHSWPMQVWTVPKSFPSENRSSSRFSTPRIRIALPWSSWGTGSAVDVPPGAILDLGNVHEAGVLESALPGDSDSAFQIANDLRS